MECCITPILCTIYINFMALISIYYMILFLSEWLNKLYNGIFKKKYDLHNDIMI